MNETIENIKIDEILEEIHYLRDENQQLKADNQILGNELTYFKELCVELEEKVNNLQKDSDCDLCLNCIECSKGLVETSIWSTAGGA